MAQRLYYVQTIPGVDPLAWSEIARRFPDATQAGRKVIPEKNVILLFRSESDPIDMLDLRASEDLFVVAARGFKISPNQQGLRQIYAAIRHSKQAKHVISVWEDIYGDLSFPATFRVVVREVGASNLMRRQIGQAAADAVLDGWQGRWRRVEEEADIELWVNLIGEELLCGLRLSRAEMRHRNYKTQHLPASLRPSVAAAMVHLTQPNENDIFLDPMAGAGTLLLERSAIGSSRKLIAGDNSEEALNALQSNLRQLDDDIEIYEWDARSLPLEDASVTKVATNLPFGKQISPGENLRALYSDLMIELERVVRPGGKIVLLSGDAGLVDSALRGVPAMRLLKRYPVNVLGYDAVISVIAR